eukprot:11933524-Heterocapsa_arctica.AAC.1
MPVSDIAETGDINHFYKEGLKQEGGHLPNTGQGQKEKLAQSIGHLPTHKKAVTRRDTKDGLGKGEYG